MSDRDGRGQRREVRCWQGSEVGAPAKPGEDPRSLIGQGAPNVGSWQGRLSLNQASCRGQIQSESGRRYRPTNAVCLVLGL
jgi:hypothetical protein